MYTQEQIDHWCKENAINAILNNEFYVVDLRCHINMPNAKGYIHGWGFPDKIVGQTAFFKSGFNIKTPHIEEL